VDRLHIVYIVYIEKLPCDIRFCKPDFLTAYKTLNEGGLDADRCEAVVNRFVHVLFATHDLTNELLKLRDEVERTVQVVSALRQLVLQRNHTSDVLVFTILFLEIVSLLLLLLELIFGLFIKFQLILLEIFELHFLFFDPLSFLLYFRGVR